MADSAGKLVIRSHAPRRRAWALGGGGAAALALLYVAFEAGRYDAGYRVIEAAQGALATYRRISALEKDNSRLRTQLEAADLRQRVDREGYKQVERSLGDMQSQIARLSQDLAFYRGLVQPNANTGVKVQKMQIQPEGPPGAFRVKFVLIQSGKPDNVATGNTFFTIEGVRAGRPATLGLAQVSPKARPSLSYSFRYFQDFDEILKLPGDFQPTRINVETRSARSASGVHQAFAWRAQGLPIEPDTKGGADVQAETD
jgi:type II secretory pathway component PulM